MTVPSAVVNKYEDLGLSGVFDRAGRRGNRQRRLSLDELAVMSPVVNRFMTENGPTQAMICKDVRTAFDEENSRRRAEERPELVTPSRETVRLAIKSLDPFQSDIARDGLEAARRKHAPVGKALELSRVLQRVEIDNWTVDLVSLMPASLHE